MASEEWIKRIKACAEEFLGCRFPTHWMTMGGEPYPVIDIRHGDLYLSAESPHQIFDRGKLRDCGPSFRLNVTSYGKDLDRLPRLFAALASLPSTVEAPVPAMRADAV